MAFISTVDEAEATGSVREMYVQAKASFGYLPNMTRLFSHRPEVNRAWTNLVQAVRAGTMDLRRYELVQPLGEPALALPAEILKLLGWSERESRLPGAYPARR